MLSIQKVNSYNSNIFDPLAKEKLHSQVLSWIVVIATSILSLGIVPAFVFVRTTVRRYCNIVEPNKTVATISNIFKKNVLPPSPKIQLLPPAFSPAIRTNSSFSSTPALSFSPNLLCAAKMYT